jgi:putative autotransporter adhesin-like protein
MHKLALIALGGLAVSAMALGAAAAIAGKDDKNFDFSLFGDRPACNFDMAGHTASRTIPWDGSEGVSIAVPADARYQRGSGDAVTVSGDANAIAHVRVRDGRIEMDCRSWHHDGRMAINLPGRTFTKFGLAGSGSMNLNGIDQPDVKLAIAGSGDVTATGKTGKLDAAIAGSGKMHLGQLAAGDVDLHIAGSGNTEIAPSGDLNVHIAGSGKVHLLTEPKHMETKIAGSGEIFHDQ